MGQTRVSGWSKKKKLYLLYLFNDISRSGSRVGTNEKPFQRVKIPALESEHLHSGSRFFYNFNKDPSGLIIKLNRREKMKREIV